MEFKLEIEEKLTWYWEGEARWISLQIIGVIVFIVKIMALVEQKMIFGVAGCKLSYQIFSIAMLIKQACRQDGDH